MTKNVLIDIQGSSLGIYLPTYIRLKVKDIDTIDLENKAAEFSATMLVSFYYGGLPKELIQMFIGKEPEEQEKQKQKTDFSDKNNCFQEETLQKEEKKCNVNKAILMMPGQMESFELRQGPGLTIGHDQEKCMVQYTIRKDFKAKLEGDVKYSPFELLHILPTFTIQSLKFQNKSQL